MMNLIVTVYGLKADANKIKAIKAIRALTKALTGHALGLRRSKDIVDGLEKGRIDRFEIDCQPGQPELVKSLLREAGFHLEPAPVVPIVRDLHSEVTDEQRERGIIPPAYGSDEWIDGGWEADALRQEQNSDAADIPF